MDIFLALLLCSSIPIRDFRDYIHRIIFSVDMTFNNHVLNTRLVLNMSKNTESSFIVVSLSPVRLLYVPFGHGYCVGNSVATGQ